MTDLTGMARAVPAAPLGVVAAGSMAVPDVLAGLESDRAGLGFIRRFMLFFGPVSSVFDFATFGVMLWIFHADAPLFRSGWFVESLATQTLVIFAIRTRRIPFFRSHPSVPLLLAALGAVTVGALLPATPLARTLGFEPLPGLFFVALALMVVCYLVLIEIGKRWFYRTAPAGPAIRHRNPGYRLLRRAARFTTADSLPGPSRPAESAWPAASGTRPVKLRPAQAGGQPAPSAGRCDADASQ